MKILEQDVGNTKEVIPILKTNFFAYMTDYGRKAFLQEVIVAPGQHHWHWISFSFPIDISDIGDRYSSFNNAINRAVNDAYCTVYEFDCIEDMFNQWEHLKYIDKIGTVYQYKGGE